MKIQTFGTYACFVALCLTHWCCVFCTQFVSKEDCRAAWPVVGPGQLHGCEELTSMASGAQQLTKGAVDSKKQGTLGVTLYVSLQECTL